MNKTKSVILVILYFSFISLGLPDEILGIAWPTMRSNFALPLSAAGILISMIAMLGAFSGFMSGYFIKRYSISTILIASGLLTACGILGTGLSASWVILILCAIPQGLGAGTIDASLNNYVAENYSSRQMNWLHGFWGVGATLGPLIMTFAIAQEQNWRLGYLIIASLQFCLTFIFILTSRWWKKSSTAPNKIKPLDSLPCKYTFCSAPSLMAMSIFFLYTGVEFSVGMWFYSLMVEKRMVAPELAGLLITLYFGFLTFGRFAIGFFSVKLGNIRIINYSLIGAFMSILLMSIDNIYLTSFSICLLGFSLSGIYPCSMHETPHRFGSQYAKSLTGYQAGAGGLGVALLPPLVGVILNHSSLTILPLVLCVMVIAMIIISRVLYQNSDIKNPVGQ